MPIRGIESFGKMADRLDRLLADFGKDAKPVGQAAAAAIVSTTLAGVGAGDRPFAPYSPAYAAQVAAAGKPGDPVNLRGVVRPAGSGGSGRGAGPARGKGKAARANRPTFHTVTRTPGRPPSTALVDPNSELSLDLITVTTTANAVDLVYTPRRDGYMVDHQTGTATLPARPWFSLDKAAVRSAALAAARDVLVARLEAFRRGR